MKTVGDYLNKYKGETFTIVGKGATRFEYENLEEIFGPIIFINDAVQLEKHATVSTKTFFFAHDPQQTIWLTSKLKSTAIIPLSGSVGSTGKTKISVDQLDAHSMPYNVAAYNWNEDYRKNSAELLLRSRSEIAKTGELFIGPGTIHTAIHFAWVCGAKKIQFIGCDGWNNQKDNSTYDSRIEIKSNSESMGVFARIRQVQDQLCESLGLETEYINEPRQEKKIPRIAHFFWAGVVPSWVIDNVTKFRSMHPGWIVKLWQDAPEDMPADLKELYNSCPQRCMQSDIVSYWLLKECGGIYLDCDVIPLRSFEPLLRYEAFAAVQSDGRINCAAMGAVPNSTAFNLVLEAVKEIGANNPEKRTSYGPNMLTELFGRGGERSTHHLTVLPQHYFYLFEWRRVQEQNEAHVFWNADERTRKNLIDAKRQTFTDPVEPYAVHLWGVDGSSKARAK